MTKDQFDRHFTRFMDRVKTTRDSGQKEYAQQNKEVFADFIWEADTIGNTPLEVMYTFLLKHIRGVGSYIQGHKSQRESVHGRLEDICVYISLIDAYITESSEVKEVNPKPKKFIRKELDLNKMNV